MRHKRFLTSATLIFSLCAFAPSTTQAETPITEWIRQFGTSSHDRAKGVSVDTGGNVYVTGHTGGSLGGPNAGPSDAFLT